MAVSSVSQAADQSKLPDHHRHHRAGSPSRLLPLLALSASLLILIVSFPSLTPHDVDLLASFYHPLLPPLAMLWLWSAAVTCWEFLHVSYEECFPPSQQRFLLTGSQIASVALSLTASAAASAAAFSAAVSWGWWWAASLQPLFLYLLIVALVAMSMGGALHSPSRVFFGRMLVRLMLPVQPVGWAEFLLADILTSLSKPLSDAERAVCLMASSTASFPLPPSPSSACPASSPLVPAVMAAPYLWRLLQCLRSYADTGASSHLANGLKYSTALPSILLSHWRHRIPPEEWDSSWQAAWVAASLLNTLFSIYWDTEKDWGVPWLHSGRLLPSPSAKNVRLYGSPFLYASAIASNAALRLTWTHKLSKGLAGSRGVALAVCLAEAARRFQWCFFRVETELLKYERKGSKPNLHALPS